MKITLSDIRKEIVRKLDTNFLNHKVYEEDVKQGMKKPAFFVEIIPTRTVNEQLYKTKSLMIKISYFSENDTNEENHLMLEQLEDLFDLSMKIKDRYFTINELNPIAVDGFLQFGFTFSVINAKDMIEIDNIDGQIQTMLSNEGLGYTQEKVRLIEELEFEKDV